MERERTLAEREVDANVRHLVRPDGVLKGGVSDERGAVEWYLTVVKQAIEHRLQRRREQLPAARRMGDGPCQQTGVDGVCHEDVHEGIRTTDIK